MERKEEKLQEPHIRPLTELVETWRMNLPRGHSIPYFDPCDAGINAKILVLMEKPGPGRDKNGVRFVSQDNDDGTATNIRIFLEESGITRSQVLLWNVVAAWDGSIPLDNAQFSQSRSQIGQLLEQLPKLQAIVLVGEAAKSTFMSWGGPEALGKRDLAVFTSPHPSPQNVNTRPKAKKQIVAAWESAAKHVREVSSNSESEIRQMTPANRTPISLRRFLGSFAAVTLIGLVFTVGKVALKKESEIEYSCVGSIKRYQESAGSLEGESKKIVGAEVLRVHSKMDAKFWLDEWAAAQCKTEGDIIRCVRESVGGKEIRSFDLGRKTLSYNWFRMEDGALIGYAATDMVCSAK